MKSILAAAVLALATAAPATAATYYFSDCQAGASPRCVPGDNANVGTSPAAPKRTLGSVKLAAGDHYRFARGGAWVDFRVGLYLPASRKDNPTVFEDYTPSWSGTDAPRPLLRSPADAVAFRFEDSGDSNHDEGYVVRNLELRGTGGTGKGVSVYNDADHITVDNVVIDGFNIGVHVAGANALAAGSDGDSRHFTLRNSVIRNHPGQGFLGAGSYLLIENNHFDNNGFGTEIRNHNVYVSHVGSHVTVRGNRLTRNARYRGGPCASVSLVSHGTHPDMLVENNVIHEDKVSGSCYGIDLNAQSTGSTKPQDFSRLVVRGNLVVLDDPTRASGTAIGCSSCPNAVIENNVVVSRGGAGSAIGINVPSSSILDTTRGDVTDTQATVRNNSLFIDAPGTGTIAIKLAGASASADTLLSNMIVLGSRTLVGRAKCFHIGARSAGSFRAVGHNLCHRAGGGALWSDQHATLALAQAAGFDLGSSTSDPMLAALPSASVDWSMAVSSGSRAIDNGHATASAPTDVLGLARDVRPDIGAHEAGATRPSAPSAVSVQ